MFFLFEPKTGANGIVPKIGAMGNLRLSVHSDEHTYLRQLLIQRRVDLGLSQRALADRLGVIHSFVGKVETGDRRLDIFEFAEYCSGLEWDALEVLRAVIEKYQNESEHVWEKVRSR